MERARVESVAGSIVREYLSRKGLKSTLQVMDQEMPRTDGCISNRQGLMKELHIEKLMKKNKEREDPFRAMLEIIVSSFMENGTAPDRPTSNKSQQRYKPPDLLDIGPAVDQPMSPTEAGPVQNGKSPAMRVSVTTTSKSRTTRSGDLLIDDDIESQTVLGDGKAGLMDAPVVTETEQNMITKTRPKSAKVRNIGASPISSNLDTLGKGRNYHKPRPLSSTGRGGKKLDLSKESTNYNLGPDLVTSSKHSLETNNDSSLSSTQETKTEKPRLIHVSSEPVLENIDSLIKKERKSSIQDILEDSNPKPSTGRPKSSRRQQEKDPVTYSIEESSILQRPPTRGSLERTPSSTSLKSSKSASSTKVGDLEFGDVDDLDNELADLRLGPSIPSARPIQNLIDARPITLQTAINVKSVFFGTGNQNFSDEWRYQSFSFCDLPNLKYGIVQKKGGPCGVLAAVQAVVLQTLLFKDGRIPLNRFGEPTNTERTNALAIALAKIFWRCGENKTAVVTMPSGKAQFQGGGNKYKCDNLTETLMINHFKSYEDLLSFLTQNIRQFECDGTGGVVLCVYSAVMSRYIDLVKSDMDEPSGKLMGAHGYCTQDLVNLLLTGKAVSNVFNDQMELESGDGAPALVLKGISGRSDVGLLSLFEHYKSCQVGTYYKTPKYPIWVVCSESHFSVLFSINKDLVSDWKAEKRFDLYYYDGLARQQEVIKLSICTTDRTYRPPTGEEELVPPIDHCIRTKWQDAQIDWNGTEPLL